MGCQHSASKRDEELGTLSHETYVTNHSRNSRNSYSSVTSLAGPSMPSPKGGLGKGWVRSYANLRRFAGFLS